MAIIEFVDRDVSAKGQDSGPVMSDDEHRRSRLIRRFASADAYRRAVPDRGGPFRRAAPPIASAAMPDKALPTDRFPREARAAAGKGRRVDAVPKVRSSIRRRRATTSSRRCSARRSPIPIAGSKTTSARSRASRAWVAAQARLTEEYLAALPGRDAIAERLTALWDYERISLPRRRGGRYFHLRNSGLEAQPVLCVREGVGAASRVLLDPKAGRPTAPPRSANGSRRAMAASSPMRCRMAAATGGRSMCSTSPAACRPRFVLRWVKFSGIAWAANGSGFFYSRFPEPEARPGASGDQSRSCRLFPPARHAQTADLLVYATPDRPRLLHVAGDQRRRPLVADLLGRGHRRAHRAERRSI